MKILLLTTILISQLLSSNLDDKSLKIENIVAEVETKPEKSNFHYVILEINLNFVQSPGTIF